MAVLLLLLLSLSRLSLSLKEYILFHTVRIIPPMLYTHSFINDWQHFCHPLLQAALTVAYSHMLWYKWCSYPSVMHIPCRDYKEYNTDTTVRFVVTINPDKLRTAEAEGLHRFFKLQTTVSLSSMVCAFYFYYSKLFCLHRFIRLI